MTDDVKIEQEEVKTDTATEVEKQDEARFNQEQLERVVEERLARQRRALLKKYEGVDIDRYNELVEQEDNRKKEEALKRQEFDTVLKQTVEKKDANISKLQNELHSIKVEGALLQSASSKKAINPSQVVSLLRNNVRMAEDGTVEVTDDKGVVRYTEDGELMSPDNLVSEFLNTNLHFVNGNSAGSGSVSNSKPNGLDGEFDISKLDMTSAKDRELYRKFKTAQTNR